MNSFYSAQELAALGLAACGKDVRISRYARIYGAEKIRVGDCVRIDDFCILSGRITIGRNVHVAAMTALYGGEAGITLDDFSNVSGRVGIYALTDDYSGRTMTNPTVPERFTGVTQAPVRIGRHAIIGTGSTVLPGVTLAEGTAVGAMSLCIRSTEPWGVYAGIPARRIKEREKTLLELEREYCHADD